MRTTKEVPKKWKNAYSGDHSGQSSLSEFQSGSELPCTSTEGRLALSVLPSSCSFPTCVFTRFYTAISLHRFCTLKFTSHTTHSLDSIRQSDNCIIIPNGIRNILTKSRQTKKWLRARGTLLGANYHWISGNLNRHCCGTLSSLS